jgi:putative endonuclease
MEKKCWEVYIVQTENGKLYTGITNDLERRWAEHKGGGKGAKFFRFAGPELLLFRERHVDRSAASKREAEIKKMSREEKMKLIRGG